MKLFYQSIHISLDDNGYKGIVFVGISFRDQKGQTVKSNLKGFHYSGLLIYTQESLDVCGTETETSSGWIPIVGSIKGAFVVKNG